MEQIEWLRISLQAFFQNNGVPGPLTDVLADRVSALFFDRVDEVVDVDRYFEILEESIQKVVLSDDYDYDLRAFIGNSVVHDIRNLLGVTSFGRAEVLRKSLEKQLVRQGYQLNEAKQLSTLAGDRVIGSPGFFNLTEKEAQKVIERVLVDMDLDKQKASSIANSISVNYVLRGPALDCVEAVEILEPDEFKELMNSRVDSKLLGKLSDDKIQELKTVLNEVYFGDSGSNSSLGLSDHFSKLIEEVADGDNSEIIQLIQKHFHSFKYPSLEMYLYLRDFSNLGVLVTKSLLEKPEEAADKEMMRVLTQQSM